jgi:hypothetical protein
MSLALLQVNLLTTRERTLSWRQQPHDRAGNPTCQGDPRRTRRRDGAYGRRNRFLRRKRERPTGPSPGPSAPTSRIDDVLVRQAYAAGRGRFGSRDYDDFGADRGAVVENRAGVPNRRLVPYINATAATRPPKWRRRKPRFRPPPRMRASHKAPNQTSPTTTLRFCPLHRRHTQYASGLRDDDSCDLNGLGQNRWTQNNR